MERGAQDYKKGEGSELDDTIPRMWHRNDSQRIPIFPPMEFDSNRDCVVSAGGNQFSVSQTITIKMYVTKSICFAKFHLAPHRNQHLPFVSTF
jgi:hypothetical protein